MTYGEVADTLLMYPVIDGYVRIDVGLVSDVVKMVKDLEKDCSRYLNHISMLQEKIKNGNEWISVEDDLPKESGELYWVYRKNGSISLAIFYNEKKPYWSYGDATHWFPLPEPPKQKEPTFYEKFLEAFPNNRFRKDDPPAICRNDVFGYMGRCPMKNTENYVDCDVCWNQPYFEAEEKE